MGHPKFLRKMGRESDLCQFDAGDFNFEAAEFGVIVFADAIGDIDQGAGFEGEFGGARSEIPSNGFDGAAAGKGRRVRC